VPSDREFTRSVMIALPGAFTKNQIAALAGEPPLADGTGDQLYAAPGAQAQVPAVDNPKGQVLPTPTTPPAKLADGETEPEGVAGTLTAQLN
jgi:hypothetical protein